MSPMLKKTGKVSRLHGAVPDMRIGHPLSVGICFANLHSWILSYVVPEVSFVTNAIVSLFAGTFLRKSYCFL